MVSAASGERMSWATCRRIDWNYHVGESAGGCHWTKAHREWLAGKIREEKNPTTVMNLATLLGQLDQMDERISMYDNEIGIQAQSETYREKVSSLCCYRGIEMITAMTLITELGDIKRFAHPRQLCGYAGMELIEYSSGGHERKYRMSKMGNQRVRTSVIESCQMASRAPQVGKKLKARREKAITPALTGRSSI